MFPVKDLKQTLTTPHINRLLILLNIIIFVPMLFSEYGIFEGSFALELEKNFAMLPYNILQGERLWTLVTSMFLHANLLHLFGNLLYLYVFGDNMEDVFGHGGYLVFYLVCGVIANFAHILSIQNPQMYGIPVEGSSGAISGVLGAYLSLYPKARILTIVIFGWPIIVPIPAVVFLGLWFLIQWIQGALDIFILGGTSNVAYWAHVGGFIAGICFAVLFGLKRKRSLEAHNTFN